MPSSDVVERDLRLDLFRAISLWLLFLEELPPEHASLMNIQAYGFSDATAIFVLVFGYTAGFVYGQVMRERGLVLATAQILRRAWQVYVAHVFLFVFYVAEISFAAERFQNPAYTEITNIGDLLREPATTMFEGLILKFQPVGMEELALYIVLLAGFAPMLWLLLHRPVIALAASATLYAFCREHQWNIAAFPNGVWPLNPLAWQLLFVFGGWLGIYRGRGFERLFGSRTLVAVAAAYLLFALLVTIDRQLPGSAAIIPDWLSAGIYPINRTDIDLVVMAHVLAIVIVAVNCVPPDWRPLKSAILHPVLACGQYSLATFCLGVFLAFAGYSIFRQFADTTLVHVLVAIIGIAVMISLASFLAWFENVPARRPAAHRGEPASGQSPLSRPGPRAPAREARREAEISSAGKPR